MSEILLIVALLAILKWMIEEGIHSKAASLLAKREGSPSGASKRGNYLGLIVRGGHALLYVAFLAVVHSITMNSILHALEELLYTPQALQDMSLLVMVDLLYVVYLCVHRSTYSRKWWRTLSRSFAPIMMFPTLFYVRLRLFYVLPGASFLGVTLALMAVVALLTLAAPYLLRAIGMGDELLRELAILLSLLLFFVVVAAGVLHPDSAVRGTGADVDWLMVVYLILFVLSMGVVGYLFSHWVIPYIQLKLKKRTTNNSK